MEKDIKNEKHIQNITEINQVLNSEIINEKEKCKNLETELK